MNPESAIWCQVCGPPYISKSRIRLLDDATSRPPYSTQIWPSGKRRELALELLAGPGLHAGKALALQRDDVVEVPESDRANDDALLDRGQAVVVHWGAPSVHVDRFRSVVDDSWPVPTVAVATSENRTGWYANCGFMCSRPGWAARPGSPSIDGGDPASLGLAGLVAWGGRHGLGAGGHGPPCWAARRGPGWRARTWKGTCGDRPGAKRDGSDSRPFKRGGRPSAVAWTDTRMEGSSRALESRGIQPGVGRGRAASGPSGARPREEAMGIAADLTIVVVAGLAGGILARLLGSRWSSATSWPG